MSLIMDTADPETQLVLVFVQHITVSMVFINQACNFYIYCLAGSRFRDEVKAVFTCKKDAAAQVQAKAEVQAQAQAEAQGQVKCD